MSNALKTTGSGSIVIGGLTFTATGIECDLAKPPSIDVARRAAKFIGRGISGTNWWAGDLANNAEHWGEEYVELLGELTLPEETVRKFAWVADRVEFVRRRTNLSWTHHEAVAPLTAAQQKKWLKKAQPKEGETKPQLSVSQLKRAIRDANPKESPPLPDDKYKVIYADPPWNYNDKCEEGAIQSGGCETHYSSMTIEELCDLPIKDMALDDSVLFMWVTSPLLEECFPIIKAWGFQYKAAFIWDKVKHNMGHYNSVRHELLLICTRGACVPIKPKLVDSVVSIERTAKHSEKPDEFRKIIGKLYPKGKRIELFARTAANGWERWGLESDAS